MGKGKKNRGVARWGGGNYYKKKKKTKSAVTNAVNKLILERRSCEKVTQKVRFGSPVFITSGIHVF